MIECTPEIIAGEPEVETAAVALALKGDADINSQSVVNQCIINTTNLTPTVNLKGSLNFGGGGGGGGSGCGRQSTCGSSETKSKSCGGGGGGCGGNKKKSCSPSKLKVVFKDINGKSIFTEDLEQDTQKVSKQSAAKAPWTTQDELDNDPNLMKYNLRSENKVFSKWSTDDWKDVERDLEVNVVYRNLITDKDESTEEEIMPDKISQEDSDKIQDFSDYYLNDKAERVRRGEIPVNEYHTHAKKYGRYNAAIETSVYYVDTVTNIINGVFQILVQHTDECTDWSTFNDLKKCLLNIQSTFIYRTRMSFNLELQDILEKIVFYTDEMLQNARKGENIDRDLKEYKEEIDLDLEFYNEDTKDRYKEFREAFNSYVDTINKCFPVNYINKI